MSKKVLIITYYFPPTGGSGVQRWVKFVKHLRSFGWEPIIYTPSNPNVFERDETLLREIPEGVEILKTPVFEISKIFGVRDTTNRANSNVSFFSRIKKAIGNYIRGNWFVPDPRITWRKPSVKFLSEYLQKNKIDAIVSTGPPHSLHLITLDIAKQFRIPWIADFRDPWLEILKFHGFSISEKTFEKHKQLLKSVLTSASAVVVAHESVRKRFQEQTNVPVALITNGYDVEDFASFTPAIREKEKLNLVFVGIFYGIRNSVAFWQALNELKTENKNFDEKLQLTFVGKIHLEIMRDLEKYGLMSCSKFTGYVEHSVAVGYEKAADALLLFTPASPEFKYEIPAKLFEYLAVNKPIICVAPEENDSAQIVLKSKAGYVVHPDKKNEIKKTLRKIFELHMQGNLKINSSGYEEYERKVLTEKLVLVLNRISELR